MQGPLQRLTIDSIAWGFAARGQHSSAASLTADGPAQQVAAWLPIQITGVRLVINSRAGRMGKSTRPKASKASKAQSKARAAATVPAVSTALALAKRLLLHLPIKLQQVVVELQVRDTCLGTWVLSSACAYSWYELRCKLC